ncbi:hypothetical protein RN001_002934 [Aquatica leii]|uniref:Tetratricopeptide repeat protein 29 n=1 Tax=Aquatica leii TaxID=1421715 RepID=A0AAN7SRF1_9COLE|nr:hypothetical protein RN001_002934 [Aquatica leii]
MRPKIYLSPIKRQKIKQQKDKEFKKYMRNTLPVYSRDDIRRQRSPYYEAVLLELGEQGYVNTKQFLWQLIEYQERLRNEQGPDAPISFKPRLLESSQKIDVLQNILKNSETAHYKGNFGQEIDGFIQLSVHFGFGSNDWWWLAEQIFVQAVNTSSQFWIDGGKKQAIIKYFYGKFLLENMKIKEKSKKLLIEARHISIGKTWTPPKEIGYKQETIFVECCNLLFTILLSEAKEIMDSDPLTASRICGIAEKRALDACNHKGQADAFLLEGLCEIEAGDANTALATLLKALLLYTRIDNQEGVCETRIHIALAFLKLGKPDKTKNNLEMLLECALNQNLPYYVAQAYRFLGEFYLNQGQPHLATPMLLKAAQIFHEISDFLNREQAKNLAAISAGQELISKYSELILKCGKNRENVIKLARWKDTRELFWSESTDKTGSKLSYVSLLHFIDDELEEKPSQSYSKSQASSTNSNEKVIEIIEMDI